MWYVLGHWNNAYRTGHKEFYWAAFEDKAEAQAYGKRKQKNGQPKEFYDWCGGGNRYFSSLDSFVAAAKKVGMNPKITEDHY